MMPEPLFLCHPVLKLTTEVRELNFGNAMVLSVSVRNRMYLPVKPVDCPSWLRQI